MATDVFCVKNTAFNIWLLLIDKTFAVSQPLIDHIGQSPVKGNTEIKAAFFSTTTCRTAGQEERWTSRAAARGGVTSPDSPLPAQAVVVSGRLKRVNRHK